MRIAIPKNPWIGNAYCKTGTKLLLVAESHYGGNDDEDYTVEVINKICQGEKASWTRMFTNLFQSFGGMLPNSAHWKIGDFYQNIAFCNYIQHVIEKGRDNPFKYLAAHNTAYVKHFQETIEELQPHFVILASKRLHDIWEYCDMIKFLKDSGIKYINTKHHSRSALTTIEKTSFKETF